MTSFMDGPLPKKTSQLVGDIAQLSPFLCRDSILFFRLKIISGRGWTTESRRDTVTEIATGNVTAISAFVDVKHWLGIVLKI